MTREAHNLADNESEKPSVTLSGTVEKVIPSPHPAIPEKAQVVAEEADHMYRELRIENSLEDDRGKKVKLKRGAHVDITIAADKSGTTSQ